VLPADKIGTVIDTSQFEDQNSTYFIFDDDLGYNETSEEYYAPKEYEVPKYLIKQLYVFPLWNKYREHTTFKYDIAIALLDRKVVEMDPICLLKSENSESIEIEQFTGINFLF
jgi:hypothetical protein